MAGIARRGLMLVLSSPSGAGKTTLARRLIEDEPGVAMSVSHTTRARRKGEKDGRDYHFVDRDTFTRMRERGEFLEWAVVFDNFYGTPRHPAEQALAEGRDVLFDVDWQGASSLRDKAKDDVVTVFILPPTAADLEQRLNVRAQDPPEIGAAPHARRQQRNPALGRVRLRRDQLRYRAVGGGGARHPRRRAPAPLAADRPQGFRAEICWPSFSERLSVPTIAHWRCGKTRRRRGPRPALWGRCRVPPTATRYGARSGGARNGASCAFGRRLPQ